jgi:hypothetical protein
MDVQRRVAVRPERDIPGKALRRYSLVVQSKYPKVAPANAPIAVNCAAVTCSRSANAFRHARFTAFKGHAAFHRVPEKWEFSRISGVRGGNARIEICVDEPDFLPM